MTGRLLAQLACVAWADADACLPDPYEWPKTSPPPTDEQLREHRRLRAIAQCLFYEAKRLGVVDTGLDSLFG